MNYNFCERLAFSKGVRSVDDLQTIQDILPGCVIVVASSPEQDRRGVDYVAALRGGAEVLIDAKTRERGCSRFWLGEPELAIEKWSICPSPSHQRKVGWTLDEAKITDMILYIWDRSDTDIAYLVGFQTLRIAARQNINEWFSRYVSGRQRNVDERGNFKYHSEAVFVPASEVMRAMTQAQSFQRRELMSNT